MKQQLKQHLGLLVCFLVFSNGIFAQEQIFKAKQYAVYDKDEEKFNIWDDDMQDGIEFCINVAKSKIIINYPDGSRPNEEYKIIGTENHSNAIQYNYVVSGNIFRTHYIAVSNKMIEGGYQVMTGINAGFDEFAGKTPPEIHCMYFCTKISKPTPRTENKENKETEDLYRALLKAFDQ